MAEKKVGRREFLNDTMRLTAAVAVGGLAGLTLRNAKAEKTVWQIDPFECTQCGRCATDCVLPISAVKCVHAYDLCGYCDLCGGYFKPGVIDLHTGAENHLCPTAAIERKFVEEPYFEYKIIDDLCIGCGKCVAGCTSFGNGSLHLQVRHDICVDCNDCAIAKVCPSQAFHRVPASRPYMIKGDFVANENPTWSNPA